MTTIVKVVFVSFPSGMHKRW